VPVWLVALFLNAFSLGLCAAVPKASTETVYCPLTKKLQPVKAARPSKNPLKNICTAENEKTSFFNGLLGANLAKTNFLDEKQFETLVFDFFQKGKAAFSNLPPLPEAPRKNSVKAFSAIAGFGKNHETEFVWKLHAEDFSFAFKSRPPNRFSADLFSPSNFRPLEKISRRIAPRAPPFSM